MSIKTIQSFTGKYHFLSNFHPCTVTYEGVDYPSVEHAYVAAKTTDLAIRADVLLKDTPGRAKRFGYTFPLREDWLEIKLQVMEDLLRQKFSIARFTEQLLATGNATLVEGNNHGDIFYGRCNGVGENHLGRLLMMIREDRKLLNQITAAK